MLFSVIIPVYNVAAYLHACVDSILGQTYPGFELILVDDGSTDGSADICALYAAKDSRVTVCHLLSGGVVKARRTGLDMARGEYVCFADGDDLVDATWLETVKACIDENGCPDMVIHDYRRDDGRTDQPLLAEPGYYDRTRLAREIWPYMLYDSRRPFFTQLLPGYLWAKIARRELYLAHYAGDERITWFEDMCMTYECIRCAKSLVVCPDKLYMYRQRADSSLLRYNPDIFQNLARTRAYLCAHLAVIDPETADQINAFVADKLVRSILHEFRHGRTVGQAVDHVSRELDRTKLAKDVTVHGLPLRIRVFLSLLKCRLYFPAAVTARVRLRIYNLLHGGREG